MHPGDDVERRPERAEAAVAELAEALIQKGWTLSTAESCTGGMIGAMLTAIAGSSAWYQGGVVSYANTAKVALLGVSPRTLEREGAVSEATAIEMAVGARRRLATDLAVSVTGIAGPGGGSASKPVGTVWIGVASPTRAHARRHHFRGGRQDIRIASAQQALRMLLDELSTV